VTYTATSGWFTNVNGHAVSHDPLPLALMSHATSWANVGPHCLTFHYQAGCGGDLTSVQIARGYPIIAFNLDGGGTIRQYCDARIAPWHAYDVSRYAIGVEHAVLPGTCNFNATMLNASAALFAALIEWTKDTYGISIPVKKIGPITPTNYKTASGIFGHLDITPGSTLNPTGHTDTLGLWSWPQYLAAINTNGGDVTTDAEKATIAAAQTFLDALTKDIGQTKDKTKAATPDGAGHRVAAVVTAAESGGGGGAYVKHQHSSTSDGGHPV
jgi:hypothetical protein